MDPNPSSAATIFTGSTILVGLSLILLSSTWKSIGKSLAQRGSSERRIAINVRGITDKKERHRAELLSGLFLGSVSLFMSVALAVIAILGVAGTMLELSFGPFGEENFNWGRHVLLWSIILFAGGVFSIGLVRAVEAWRLKQGKGSLLAGEGALSETGGATTSGQNEPDPYGGE